MKNETFNVFLPLFYLVWSDELLTRKEFETLGKFINSQHWLSLTDKEALLRYIDETNPPTRIEISEWNNKIQAALKTNPSIKNLFDLSIHGSEKVPVTIPLRTAYLQLENDLGISGEEVIAGFKTGTGNATLAQKKAAGFNVARLTEILDGDRAAIIKKVKAVISRPEFAYEKGTDITAYRERVYEWCRILAKEQFGNMAYPKQYGGGENMSDYFAIMETLSFHDLSLVIKFGVQFGLWGMSVYSLGTEKHHRKYLQQIGSFDLPGCFAMTETHHGSNVKGLETTATYNHSNQTFIIHTPNKNAQKEYIGNAACHGQMATVFAKLIIAGKDYGVNAFIVPLRDDTGQVKNGVTIADCGIKMGLNGVDNGTISFDHLVIPKDNMLDRFASINESGIFESPIPSDNRRFFTMLGTLVGGRIGIPRSALSAAKSGLTITIRYSDQRRQFGPEGAMEIPVLDYSMHQRRLMPLLAKTYALHFALQYVTNRYLHKNETEMQEIEALAAGMKAYATWSTRDILQECREACGGKGYLSENRIDALKNDTEIYTTFEGDNTVLMLLVARNRLAAFRKLYGKMDAMGMISYVFEQAKTVITEKNPIATRKTDNAHLLDDAFHLHSFEHREKTILASAVKRIKKLIDNGVDSSEAFNIAQHQMIDVAQAYLERVTLEQCQLAIKSIDSPDIKIVLEQLCQLFALTQIDKNKGWYLEDGYMDAIKTKAIRNVINELCRKIRPDAVSLVNAFDIPASCLAAPIAFL